MANITVLVGSPRKDGNTEMLSDAFIKSAETAGHTVQKIHIGGKKIGGCLGCDYCMGHGGECIQKDDMQSIYEAMKITDMLILASPLYYWGFTAQIKAVIDRFYASITKPFPIKTAALLMTCGAETPQECDAAVTYYRALIKGVKWEDKGVVIAEKVMNKGDIKGHPALEAAAALGKKL